MRQRRTIGTLAMALALALTSAVALAQTPQPASPRPMSGMHAMGQDDASRPTAGDADHPSVAAFQAADQAMMHKMAAPYTGDTDQDFVAHMMPHHEGAVEMARIELQYGKDPALKRMAREIIRSQEREITFMKKWQAQHGVR